MTLTEGLAIVDAIVGLYLIGSLRRTQRHKEAVLAVGLVLLLIAGGLLWIGWERDLERLPVAPSPTPDVQAPA